MANRMVTLHIHDHEISGRQNEETKRTASWIRACQDKGLKTEVQQDMGITDEAVLSVIGSVSFPWSFPIDIMHLLFENIMKSLLSSWAGTYKMGNITTGEHERLQDAFVIGDTTAKWKAMSREIAGSNPLVPSTLASRVQDLDARGWWTAETYSYFLLFLGPIVLKDRLPPQYFLHFLQLSDIARTITKLEIVKAEVPQLKVKIARWVLDYEKLYYQYKPSHLPFCTAPIHALLHVADNISWQGPPCRYWCFSLERYGGWLKRELNNNQLPVVALSNRIVKQEQIYQLLTGLSPVNRALIVEWETGKKARPTWGIEHDGASLFDKLPNSYRLSNRVLDALRVHLQTRAYSQDRYYQRGAVRQISRETVAALPISVYSSWRSSGDDGRQLYRTEENRRGLVKDASWALYDQAYDRNQRSSAGRADFQRIMKMQWGKVLHFVEFSWQNEVIQAAVVQPWDSVTWLEDVSTNDFKDPPSRLVKEVSQLQVMSARALRHFAGRIPIDGSNKWVIFETSLGLLVPEMV